MIMSSWYWKRLRRAPAGCESDAEADSWLTHAVTFAAVDLGVLDVISMDDGEDVMARHG